MEGAQPVDLIRHPSGIVPVLQNIVSTVNLDCRLDLKQIALQARNAEYNPKRFAAVIMRIRDPKTTTLIFASGKMVCTGAKSEEHSKLAARKYARIVQKLGFPATFKDFKIQNIVASCDVKFPIRLEGLAYSHGAFSSVMFPVLEPLNPRSNDIVHHYWLFNLNIGDRKFEILDSWRTINDKALKKCYEFIRATLYILWEDNYITSIVQIESFNVAEIKVPQQVTNSYCDVCTLMNADWWDGRVCTEYTPKDISNIKKLMTHRWFTSVNNNQLEGYCQNQMS